MKESEKVGLKINIQKTKILASGPITLWEIDGGNSGTVADFYYLLPSLKYDFHGGRGLISIVSNLFKYSLINSVCSENNYLMAE